MPAKITRILMIMSFVLTACAEAELTQIESNTESGHSQLVVHTPGDQEILDAPMVMVTGSAPRSTFVIINGARTAVVEGQFSQQIQFSDIGPQSVTVQTDDAQVTRRVIIDTGPPILLLTSPERGALIESGGMNTVLVEGSVMDTNGVPEVMVAGTSVAVGANGRFSHRVALEPGVTTINVEATGQDGMVSSDIRSVLYGDFIPWGEKIEDGLGIRVSEAGWLKISEALSAQFTQQLSNGIPLPPPSPQFQIRRIEIGEVGVDIVPRNGVLQAEFRLYDLNLNFDTNALGSSMNVDIDANPASLSMGLNISVDPQGLVDISFRNAEVDFDDFDFDVGGFLGIFDWMIKGLVKKILEGELSKALQGFVANDVFSVNNLNQRVDLLGQSVDFQLDLKELSVQPVGMVVQMDAGANFGSGHPLRGPGTFRVPADYPSDSGAKMLRLNLNPNFVNQLLGGFWARDLLKLNLMDLIGSLGDEGGMELPFDTTAGGLGTSLGAIGLADMIGADTPVGIIMDPQLPPVVSNGDSPDSLVIDLAEVHFHFTHGEGTRWATIAAHIKLTIATDADLEAGEGILEIEVSTDLIDEPLVNIDDETAEGALRSIFEVIPAILSEIDGGGVLDVAGMTDGNPDLGIAALEVLGGPATGGFISLMIDLGKKEEPLVGRDLEILHTEVNPLNGHTLHMLEQSTWLEAEAMARQLGGHLVTIRSEAENDWILDTFGELDSRARRDFWIGLHDTVVEGRFTWTSGEPVTWEGWRRKRPDNGSRERNVQGSEDYVHMYGRRGGSRGQWNDTVGANQADWNEGFYGIVEVVNAEMVENEAN